MDGADAVAAVRRPWHSWTAHLTLHPGLSGGFPQISRRRQPARAEVGARAAR